MDKDKIQALLSQFFDSPERQIVFWYDSDGCEAETVNELELDGVKLHKLTGSNYFATKKLLEYDDKNSSYLVYAPFEKPEVKDNWLSDIIFYSHEFTPDVVAMTIADLKINDPSVKQLVKNHADFFNNTARVTKLKSLLSDCNNEENFEHAMIAVIAKSKAYQFESTMQKVIIDSLIENNDVLKELEKFELLSKFWQYAKKFYGYEDKEPSVKKLFTSIILTSLKDGIKDYFPKTLEYLLCDESKAHNSTVFIDNWMNNKQTGEFYKTLAKQTEQELKIRESIKDWEELVVHYNEVDVFECFDREAIMLIIKTLLANNNGFAGLTTILRKRKAKYWFERFEPIYNALEAALELFSFMFKYQNGFPLTNAKDLLYLYTKEYYKVDQAYRKFYTAFDKEESSILDELRERVEGIYSNKYLDELTKVWSEQVEIELTENWDIMGIHNQKDFYTENIKNSKYKTFVVISDALRYEAAQELVIELNKEVKGDAELDYMLGSVPSYTKLGMAALLPNKKIEINTEGQVLVDGIRSDSSNNREKILQSYVPESVVVKYFDLKKLKLSEARDVFKDKKVIYIYHDKIDAIGDDAKTENDAFYAVKKTIKELIHCLKIIINCNGTHVYITADHGFLYKRDSLEEHDKVSVAQKDSIELKKRFILTNQPSQQSGALQINMEYILGKGSDLKAIVPKGIHRFKTAGTGINFVHGGASLQEIVIPLIKFQYKRHQDTKKVDIKVTNRSNKITNNNFTLNLFQVERVSDKVLQRKLKVALWDTDLKKQISSEETVFANIESDNPKDREFKIVLTLKGEDYDKNKNYYLKLEEDGLQIDNPIPFQINLAITNDF